MPCQVRQRRLNPISREASEAPSVRRHLYRATGQHPEAAVTMAGAGFSVATTATILTNATRKYFVIVNNAADQVDIHCTSSLYDLIFNLMLKSKHELSCSVVSLNSVLVSSILYLIWCYTMMSLDELRPCIVYFLFFLNLVHLIKMCVNMQCSFILLKCKLILHSSISHILFVADSFHARGVVLLLYSPWLMYRIYLLRQQKYWTLFLWKHVAI